MGIQARRLPIFALACFSIHVVSGCSGDTATDEGLLHLDEVPQWTLQEELRIGSVEDPAVGFSQVRGIRALSDGGFYVSEGLDRQIRIYNSDGQLIRRVGRRGEGPGEFESVGAFGITNDTLWVTDTRNLRVTLFTAGGDLLGTVPGDRFSFWDGETVARISPRRLRSDGYFLGVPVQFVFEDSMRVPIVRFDAQGEVVDTLRWRWLRTQEFDDGLGGRERVEVGGGVLYLRERLFPDGLVRRQIEDGTLITIVPASLGAGSGTTLRLTYLRPEGDTAVHGAFGYHPMPAPETVRDEAFARLLENAERVGIPRGAAEGVIRSNVRVPPYLYPITHAVLANDGSLWLKREDTGDEEARWTVIDSNGIPGGEIRLARSTEVHAINGDRVWVVERDELDVPYVLRYRIERD